MLEFLSRLRDCGPVVVNIGNDELDFASPQEFLDTARMYGAAVIGTVRGACDGMLRAPTHGGLRANYRALSSGADCSILLSHAGLSADAAILPGLPGSTVFAVNAHDHLTLRQEVAGGHEAMEATIAAVRRQYRGAEDAAIAGRVRRSMSVLEAAKWAVETVRDAAGADVTARDGRQYTIVTASWVGLDSHQQRYLGATVAFEKVPGVTTKGLLLQELNR